MYNYILLCSLTKTWCIGMLTGEVRLFFFFFFKAGTEPQWHGMGMGSLCLKCKDTSCVASTMLSQADGGSGVATGHGCVTIESHV